MLVDGLVDFWMLSLGQSPSRLLQYHPRRCLLLFFAKLVDQMFKVCIVAVRGCFPGGLPSIFDVRLRFVC